MAGDWFSLRIEGEEKELGSMTLGKVKKLPVL